MNNSVDFVSENLEVYVKCRKTSEKEFRPERFFPLLASVANLKKKKLQIHNTAVKELERVNLFLQIREVVWEIRIYF